MKKLSIRGNSMIQETNISMAHQFITAYLPHIILFLTGMLVVALLFFIHINIKLAKMSKRYKKLMAGMDGANIERLLMGHIDEVRQLVKKVDAMEQENKRINLMAKKSIQKVGIVRYNAFESVGSDLSYSIALLDAQNDGIILTSIFGRDESRCYAKPVIGGASSYSLAEEEKNALSEAMKK